MSASDRARLLYEDHLRLARLSPVVHSNTGHDEKSEMENASDQSHC